MAKEAAVDGAFVGFYLILEGDTEKPESLATLAHGFEVGVPVFDAQFRELHAGSDCERVRARVGIAPAPVYTVELSSRPRKVEAAAAGLVTGRRGQQQGAGGGNYPVPQQPASRKLVGMECFRRVGDDQGRERKDSSKIGYPAVEPR